MKISCSSHVARIKHPSKNDWFLKPVMFHFWKVHTWGLVINSFKAHQEILGNNSKPPTFLLDPVSTKRSDCRTRIRPRIPFKLINGWQGTKWKHDRYFEPRLPIDQCLMILMYFCWLSSLRFFLAGDLFASDFLSMDPPQELYLRVCLTSKAKTLHQTTIACRMCQLEAAPFFRVHKSE